ncbi:MAG: hypothetical protein IPO09_17630 [Anaeromyxobacter sp.]|nr:hypothetical protein [Anaeromyxobacter sp.]MBL0276479.1 hypothetical protein [Anaeromyxobacter sp.]
MARLLHARLEPCPAERFTRSALALLDREGVDPVLLTAPLTGQAVLLGRHQRAASAIRLEAARAAGLPLVRRVGGGRALLVGEGALGVFLAVPPGAALVPGPFGADKVLNRYVRGLLAGLRAGGARSAAWFGRDFVSSGTRRVAVVSQETTAGGATALEALVAVRRDLALPPGLRGYPEHADPRVEGPPPATLAALRAEAPARPAAAPQAGVPAAEGQPGAAATPPSPLADAVAMADVLARAYAAATGRDLEPFDAPLPEAPPLPALEDEAGLSRSGVAEIAAGFVEVLLRHDGARVQEVRLRGDLMAPAATLAALERALVGCPLERTALGRRVDAAFAGPGAFVHGLTDLGLLPEAILAAAAP